MTIDHIDNKTLEKIPNDSSCNIHCLHIKINDIKPIIKEIEVDISDTSWINDLDELSKKVFKANAEKTINKIVNDIIAKVDSNINTDIGEYIVSYSAQHSLEINFSHKKIPLAELLKEKISGNPGFDFHSISSTNYLIFGEAKFSIDSTPRSDALEQIEKFIGDKDNGELFWLQPFLDEQTKTNIINDEKGYAAAFSFNGNSIIKILNNALESSPIKKIIQNKELYLIAVELC
ncbi:hypothetical protein N6B72_17365 [Chryseobacterium soli]|uniref:hypothetical protein n=1 Tax=Chryseobacterium soli TaxID=445961 RepID=UPI002952C915|nr:hypothetical protein [Chryseobacterium soli]MDV7698697.1 hypothetical protein [Chryseobacterium soli]